MAKRAPSRKKSASAAASHPGAPESAPPHPPPRPIDAIRGHDRPIAHLTAALEAGRLHHAWVFHGPRGVGKFTTALSFAALLLDPTTARDLSGRLAPDPESRVQSLLASGSHPDLHIITKELARFSDDERVRKQKHTQIAGDVVRSRLIRPAQLAPKLGERGAAGKVFIVDEAELLNAASQNALLKTLEEPPEGTVIILVTAAEDRLLPTIRSRCQRVAFTPLEPDAMTAWANETDLTPAQRQWADESGRGSPGFVLEAVTTGLLAWRDRLAPMIRSACEGRLPVALGQEMHTLVSDWASARVEGERQASKEAANREASDRMLALVADLLAARLRTAADPEVEARRIDAVSAAQRRLSANVNMQMVFDALAAELARPPLLASP
ncbi:MAG: DNA polymerase III subunit [Phycisphaerales bacterium]